MGRKICPIAKLKINSYGLFRKQNKTVGWKGKMILLTKQTNKPNQPNLLVTTNKSYQKLVNQKSSRNHNLDLH